MYALYIVVAASQSMQSILVLIKDNNSYSNQNAIFSPLGEIILSIVH